MKYKMALSKKGYRTGLGQKLINKSTSCLQLSSTLIDQSEDYKDRRLRKPTY